MPYKLTEKAPTGYSDKKTTTELPKPSITYATSHNVCHKNITIQELSRNKSHNSYH